MIDPSPPAISSRSQPAEQSTTWPRRVDGWASDPV